MRALRKFQIHNSKFISVILLWQLLSVYLMATGVWPASIAWVNLVLLLLYILLVPAFSGLLLVVASIPFYIVLPQPYSDTFSMWRPVVAVLFLKTLFSVISGATSCFGAGDPESIPSNAGSRIARAGLVASGMTRLGSLIKTTWIGLMLYEKLGIALFILGVLSLALARYPLRGVSQLMFLLNTALLYPVVVWAVKNREQWIKLLTYGVWSTGIIIAIGYVQFIATLFSTTYYFWQYWALRVASLYYGLTLAKVLQYSNSWVTVQGEEKTLRMFSIMTSSHAFAMVCVLFLAFVLPLIVKFQISNNKSQTNSNSQNTKFQKRRCWSSRVNGQWSMVNGWLAAAVVLACLALIISGTRGVWTAMVPALGGVMVLYYWKSLRLRELVVPIFGALLFVVILFEASPVFDQAFAWVRNAGWRSGTYERIASIVDTGETSNAGRLEMWKSASKYALQHPFGVGYANFVVTLSPNQDLSFEEAASQENTLYNLPQRYITAHSLYLQLLVELSIVGLALFGVLWLSFVHRAWLCIRTRVVSAETVFVTTLTTVFLWFLAYGVFDVTWLNDKILLYTFLIFGLARFVFTRPVSGGQIE